MSKLFRYCIHEESYYEPKLLYIAREKPKQKPHLPSLAHVTHICEGRRVGLIVSWNIRYTIQHWVLLYSIPESKPCIQFEVRFWCKRTNLN
jgi:hypothetical protein